MLYEDILVSTCSIAACVYVCVIAFYTTMNK